MKSVSKKRPSNPQHTEQPANTLPRYTGIDYQFKTCKKNFHTRLFLQKHFYQLIYNSPFTTPNKNPTRRSLAYSHSIWTRCFQNPTVN